MKIPKQPPMRFSGRLYYAAKRMTRLAETLNELEGAGLMKVYGRELASIEESISEFEKAVVEYRMDPT